MNCAEIRERIRDTIENDRTVRDDAKLARHIDGCELCRRFYSDLMLDRQLSRTLKEMPVPEPSFDFAAGAIQHAVDHYRSRRRRSFSPGWAAAAVLIIAVAVTLMIKAVNPAGSVTEVSIPVGGEKTVRVLIEAVESRKNATLAITLAGDIALKDFPGQDRLQWQTDLNRGGNLLALPLKLKDRAGGDVKVNYSYNGTEKEVRIQVRAG